MAGAAAVSVPILIHLLNRRRYRVLDWAAMQFLLESVRQNRRRLRIEELILLAMRCLAIFLLGSALGRFSGCAEVNVLPGVESQSIVFLLDDSYSMGQRRGGESIFAAAVTEINEQINQLSPSDQVVVLLASADPNDEPLLRLSLGEARQKEEVAARLTALKPSDRRTKLSDGLAAAAKIFSDDRSANRRLYVYGDFRRVDLSATAENDALRRQFETLRKNKVDVRTMDFGREGHDNLTIESFEVLDRFAVARVPLRMRLEVRNNGSASVSDVEVTFKATLTTPEGAKEVELPKGVIDKIDAGSTGRAEVSLTCPNGGAVAVTATLNPDELLTDSTAELALDVRDSIRVLVVDGKQDLTDPSESESFFLSHALDPHRDGSYGVKVDVVSPEALSDSRFDEYDTVALLNVAEMPATVAPVDPNGKGGGLRYPQLEALSEYVRRGGGLAIFTGDQINLTFWNGPMHAEGAGLNPFRLGGLKGDVDRRASFFRMDPRSIVADPLTRVFTDFLREGLDPTRFLRFHAFTSSTDTLRPSTDAEIKPARVLVKFGDPDNSPAIVSRGYGKGTVVMFLTSACMRWTDWPADENGTYVAMMNDLVTCLARPQSQSLSAMVGEPVTFDLPDKLRDATATLQTPRFPEQAAVPLVPAVLKDDRTQQVTRRLSYPSARSAGRYKLELAMADGTAQKVFFARTPDPLEGQLACGRQAALASALGSEDFVYVDRTAPAMAGETKVQPRKEYWMWIILGLLVLLLAETMLGQKFGHHYD